MLPIGLPIFTYSFGTVIRHQLFCSNVNISIGLYIRKKWRVVAFACNARFVFIRVCISWQVMQRWSC